MRIISYESARVTMLFPFEEIAPLGGADGKNIVSTIAHKYSFSVFPDMSSSREELDKKGLIFEGGVFEYDGKQVNILRLSVHSDGVNVDANVSDSADMFLSDILLFLRSTFGFREFTSRPKTHYWSIIVVEFDSPMARLINRYQHIANLVHDNVAPHYEDGLPPCGLSRLEFRWDTSKPEIREPGPRFFIERRLNIPFERERYFSGASMRTQDHERALQDMERLIDSE